MSKLRMERVNELNEDMVEIIEYHLPGKSEDTITWYKNFKHDTVLFYTEDGVLDSMLSYFILDFKFDTIVAMQRQDKFSRQLWKILSNTLKTRVKPIRIMSDPTKPQLHKGAARYGGKFIDDEIWFY